MLSCFESKAYESLDILRKIWFYENSFFFEKAAFIFEYLFFDKYDICMLSSSFTSEEKKKMKNENYGNI